MIQSTHTIWSYVEMTYNIDGYNCAILFQPLGYRCGYVQIPKSHPLYRKRQKLEACICCHGGITFAQKGLPGVLDVGYWIGFDCIHGSDKPDLQSVARYFPDSQRLEEIQPLYECAQGGHVRDFAFVEKEIASIVEQLKKLEGAG